METLANPPSARRASPEDVSSNGVDMKVNLLDHCAFCLRRILSEDEQRQLFSKTANEGGKSVGKRGRRPTDFNAYGIERNEITVVPKFERSGGYPLLCPETFGSNIWQYLITNTEKRDEIPKFNFWMGMYLGLNSFQLIPPMCAFCGSRIERINKTVKDLKDRVQEIRQVIKLTCKKGIYSERYDVFQNKLKNSAVDKDSLKSTLKFLDWLGDCCEESSMKSKKNAMPAPMAPGDVVQVEAHSTPSSNVTPEFSNTSFLQQQSQCFVIERDPTGCAVNIIKAVQIPIVVPLLVANNQSEFIAGPPPDPAMSAMVRDVNEMNSDCLPGTFDSDDFDMNDCKVKSEPEKDDDDASIISIKSPFSNECHHDEDVGGQDLIDDNGSRQGLLLEDKDPLAEHLPQLPLKKAASRKTKRIRVNGVRKRGPIPISVPTDKCNFCRATVPLSEMLDHMKGHVGDFVCKCPNPACPKLFSCTTELEKHHISRSAECKKFLSPNPDKQGFKRICDTCGFETHSKLKLRSHLQLFHETAVKSFTCPVSTCDKAFSVKQSVDLHIASHTSLPEPTTQKCTACKKVIELEKMTDHLKVEHSAKEIILCNNCPYQFSNREDLFNHLMDHVRQEELISCDLCKDNGGEKFKYARLSKLREHYFNEHQIGEMVVCEYCTKQFLSIKNLDNHVKIQHTKTKIVKVKGTFKCDVCIDEPVFKTEAGLISHKILHGEPLSCRFCQDKFTCVNKLRFHEMEHKGVSKQQFRCDIEGCGKILKSKKSLETHRRTIEHVGRTNQYKCDICSKGFNYEERLRAHRDAAHFVTRVICDECGESFAGEKVLETHKLIHAGAFPFQCPICHQKFRHRSTLITHKRSHMEKGDRFRPSGPMKNTRKRRKVDVNLQQ